MPDPHQLVTRRKYFGVLPGLRLWHLPELVAGWLWGKILHRTICVNARDFSARLIRDYGYSPKKLGVIYNGIDTNAQRIPSERMAEAKADRAALRQCGERAAQHVELRYSLDRVDAEYAVEYERLCS
jgi:glycosyltransferase involved in cell wall biosynthesis